MGVARKILKWCDNEFDEALHEPSNTKAGRKAFTSGLVEGFIDASIVLYVPALIICYAWQCKATKK